MSRNKLLIALLITKVEYMATTLECKEVVYLHRLCYDVGSKQAYDVRLDCDNHSVIFLAKNPSHNLKTKHIDVQYHFVRVMAENHKVSQEKVDTMNNVANLLTKSMSIEKFYWCREMVVLLALCK